MIIGRKSRTHGEKEYVLQGSIIDRHLSILKVALFDSEKNTSTRDCFCKTVHQKDKCVNERESQLLSLTMDTIDTAQILWKIFIVYNFSRNKCRRYCAGCFETTNKASLELHK